MHYLIHYINYDGERTVGEFDSLESAHRFTDVLDDLGVDYSYERIEV